MVLRIIDNNVAVYDFFRRKNARLHQFIVKSMLWGRQTVIGSSSSKVILTILSRPISFISPWFWGKLTILCLFMIFPLKKCTFPPIYRKISAGGRQAVFGSSSSKVILIILSRPISFISPWFWEKLKIICLFMIFFAEKMHVYTNLS